MVPRVNSSDNTPEPPDDDLADRTIRLTPLASSKDGFRLDISRALAASQQMGSTKHGAEIDPGINLEDVTPQITQDFGAQGGGYDGNQGFPFGIELVSPDKTAFDSQERIKITENRVRLSRPQGENYVLKRCLGQGGQGIVYEAWQVDLRRPVAIKLSNRIEPDLDNFLTESLTVARLAHSNVVPIYGVGLARVGETTVPAIVMQYIRGRSWKDILSEDRKAGTLSLEEFLEKHLAILLQALNALAFAHSRNIIHRDLKPAQIMVGDHGEVHLGDWGLAMVVDGSDKDHQISNPDTLVRLSVEEFDREIGTETSEWKWRVPDKSEALSPAGTPAYMAPEQVKFGGAELGISTDIYLVGAIIYELMVGHPVHTGKSLRSVIRTALTNSFRAIPEEAPGELADLVRQCLDTEPANRPESLAPVMDALRDYLSTIRRGFRCKTLMDGMPERIAEATTYCTT